LKDKVATNAKEILEVDYKLDLAKEKIRMHEEHVEKLLSNSQEVIDELQEKIAKYELDIAKEEKIVEEKRNSLSALIEQTTDYDKLNTKLGAIVKIEHQMHDRIERLTNEASFFENHDNCPTCKQIIDEAFKTSAIAEKNSAIDEVNNGLLAIDSKAKLLEQQIAGMKVVMEQVSSINMDINIKTNKMKSIKTSVSDLREQISKINRKSEAYTNDDQALKALENELEEISEDKKELFEVKEVHKVVSSILKDTGIKAKIIKQYVPIINKLINKYLAAMDFFVQFELDENFNETIKSRFRDAFSYSSFSEGEKSKIDLALLFTWRTIARLRNSASTNILILDEVFDGSLDAGSSEELLKILIELSNDSNVLVISHRTDQLLDKFDRVIRFEKKANFSRMAIEERKELA
jgi:DNA repair exonuclease SbcCD ATPase subunit